MFPQKMEEVKRELISFTMLVEGMISKSIQGLIDKNEALLREVIETDEPRANDFDRNIDEAGTVLIAQFEPLAKDLRTALMILKMNKDLERIADHAVNISESAIFLIQRPFLKKPVDDICVMAQASVLMLKDSINAFVNADAALAKAVFQRDNTVDQLGDGILEELTRLIKGEHDGVKRSLNLMRIAHNLERIADLSTNICEEVIYIVEGKDVKHRKITDAS